MHDLGQDNVAAGRWVETVMTSVRMLVAEIDRDAAGGARRRDKDPLKTAGAVVRQRKLSLIECAQRFTIAVR